MNSSPERVKIYMTREADAISMSKGYAPGRALQATTARIYTLASFSGTHSITNP
jgi:hypothetical protein